MNGMLAGPWVHKYMARGSGDASARHGTRARGVAIENDQRAVAGFSSRADRPVAEVRRAGSLPVPGATVKPSSYRCTHHRGVSPVDRRVAPVDVSGRGVIKEAARQATTSEAARSGPRGICFYMLSANRDVRGASMSVSRERGITFDGQPRLRPRWRVWRA